MAKTEVILTHNIVGLGGESDHVKVAAGYARNYLYPQGLAIPVTAANKRRLEVLKQRRGERESHELNTMTELAKSLSKLVCVVTAKTGEDGCGEGDAEALTHDTGGGQQTGRLAELSARRRIHEGARVRRLEHSLSEPGEHQAADDPVDRAVGIEPRQQEQTRAREGEPSRRQPA